MERQKHICDRCVKLLDICWRLNIKPEDAAELTMYDENNCEYISKLMDIAEHWEHMDDSGNTRKIYGGGNYCDSERRLLVETVDNGGGYYVLHCDFFEQGGPAGA